LWLAYEKRIKDLVKALDANASVEHNAKIRGLLSGVERQIDVLVEGTIAGQSIRVVVEAKRHGRRITIETVDGFVGKLLDLGAERGIIYSYAGFTEGALRRAGKQRNPAIALERFEMPTEMADGIAYLLSTSTRSDAAHTEWRRTPVAVPGHYVETYEEFLRGEGFLFRRIMI
jgi:hypothetical protein